MKSGLGIRGIAYAAVGALAVVPAPLAAYTAFMDATSCTSSFTACASVQVTTSWDGTKTSVVIKIRNWGLGNTSDGVARSITGIQIHSPEISANVPGPQLYRFNPTVTTLGNVATVNGGGLTWGPNDAIAQELWSADILNFGYGIAGCDLSGWGSAPGLSTCASPGEASWVVLSFTTNFEWSVYDAQVALLTSHPGYYGYYEGKIGFSCPGPGCIITPEPITSILLATGLAGMGGFSALRRRRKPGDDLT